MDALVRFAADGLLIIIICVAGIAGVYYVVRYKHLARIAPYAVLAALTSLLAAKLVSLLYQPSVVRPFVEKGIQAGAAYIDNPGFPSDHALLATVVVAMLLVVTPYRKLALILGILTIIMSIGRVIAQVHTPLDVIAGTLFGLLGVVWYRRLPRA